MLIMQTAYFKIPEARILNAQIVNHGSGAGHVTQEVTPLSLTTSYRLSWGSIPRVRFINLHRPNSSPRDRIREELGYGAT
jgi:hypothetical protein